MGTAFQSVQGEPQVSAFSPCLDRLGFETSLQNLLEIQDCSPGVQVVLLGDVFPVLAESLSLWIASQNPLIKTATSNPRACKNRPQKANEAA